MMSSRHWKREFFAATFLVCCSFIVLSVDAADELKLNTASGNTIAGSPAMSSKPVSSTYLLSSYDVIDVSVYGEESLHTRAKLGSDGSVLLPLIGKISLAGRTVTAGNEAIRKAYADGGLVKDPHVLLTVVEYRKRTFSIIGQVNRPGVYELPEGAHLSVVDAVLIAGGFTRTADQNGVNVKRTIKGSAHIFKVKAGSMAEKSNVALFEIKGGDVINVKQSLW